MVVIVENICHCAKSILRTHILISSRCYPFLILTVGLNISTFLLTCSLLSMLNWLVSVLLGPRGLLSRQVRRAVGSALLRLLCHLTQSDIVCEGLLLKCLILHVLDSFIIAVKLLFAPFFNCNSGGTV